MAEANHGMKDSEIVNTAKVFCDFAGATTTEDRMRCVKLAIEVHRDRGGDSSTDTPKPGKVIAGARL